MKQHNHTQEEIDNLISIYNKKINQLNNEIDSINHKILLLKKEANNLYDPHALIPNEFNNINDWLKKHPFPNFVKSMIYKNKTIAYNTQLSCNTFQTDYHIVKC